MLDFNPFVFRLTFSKCNLNDLTHSECNSFIVTAKGLENLYTGFGLEYDSSEEGEYPFDVDFEPFQDILDECESHGTHDFSHLDSNGLDGIGFEAYEMNQEDIKTVMKIWRDWFVEHCGEENVSQIARIEISDGENLLSDRKYYNRTIKILKGN